MDIDEHFDRLTGVCKDATYWKMILLGKSLRKNVPDILTECKDLDTLTYDHFKCIELQNTNGVTAIQEIELFDKLPTNKTSAECLLVYLNILLTRPQLPIICEKLKHKLLTSTISSDLSNLIDPIQRRIKLLTGTSTINSVFEEDDLLVLHLLHSKNILQDFDLFADNTNYRDDLILDFILYDCEQAKFLQVLLKVFKNKCIIIEKYPELHRLLDNLVSTLKKCKDSLIYNPQVLINYWEKKL